MTEEGGGKKFNPRSHSLSQPYGRNERRKSLLGKVKDSVKDILSPSWLSDLVSSIRKDSPPKSNVDDQEVFMSPAQPPPLLGPPNSQNEATLRTSGPENFYPGVRGNGQPRTLEFPQSTQGPTMLPTAVPPISEFTSSQLPLTRLTEKSDSVLANEDNQSQRSDYSKSTSGCSSMIPHPERKDYPSEDLDRGTPTSSGMKKTSRDPEMDVDTPASKRARLYEKNQSFSWTNRYNTSVSKQQVPAAANKPGFNSTLFGSPVMDDLSVLGTSFHESSFYPGKTMYGGRSATRKKADNLNKSLPSKLSFPVRTFVKPKQTPGTSAVSAVTSSTARRIMETLDKMSSPVRDARKFPVLPSAWTENKSFSGPQQPSRSSGPPKQKLHVNSLASISTNRQTITSPVKHSRSMGQSSLFHPETSQQQKAPGLSSQDTVLLNSRSSSSGKAMRDKSYHKGSAAAKQMVEEEEEVEMPNLKTDFTLPVVSGLPKIAFSGPGSATTFKPSTAKGESPAGLKFAFSSPIQVKPTPATSGLSQTASGSAPQSMKNTDEAKQDSDTSDDLIMDDSEEELDSEEAVEMFDSPLKPGAQEAKTGKGFQQEKQTFSSEKNYQFSSPISMDSKKVGFQFAASAVQPAVPKSSGSFGSTAAKPRKSAQPNSLASAGVSGFAPAAKLKQGSVMDILGGGGGFAPAATLKQGSVMDVLGAGKVTSSSSPNSAPGSMDLKNKPGPKTATVNATDSAMKPVPPVSDLFSKFKPATGSWTCDTCLVQNKPEVDKCMACQSAKPAGKSQAPASTAAVPAASQSLASKFAMPTGNWICDVCLIQNKASDDKCGACCASRPKKASESQSEKKASTNKPASSSWTCDTCLVPNKSDDTRCVCCQTAKPVSPFKYPVGDWVCDTCLVNNKEGTYKCIACEYSRPGPPKTETVPSGVKIAANAVTTGGFNLGGKTASSSVPIKFGDGGTGSGFKFGDTTSSTKEKSMPAGFKFGEATSSNKAVSSGSGFQFGDSSNTSSKESAGGFKFGSGVGSTDKPAQGFMFGDKGKTESSVSKESINEKTTASIPVTSITQNTQDQVSSVNTVTPSASSGSAISAGGLVFGQKTDTTSDKSSLQSIQSVNSNQLPSYTSSIQTNSSSSNKAADTSVSKSGFGGFNFSAGTKPTVNSTTNVSQNTGFSVNDVQGVTKPGGFNFSSKPSAPSIGGSAMSPVATSTEAVGKPADSKSASFGGFNFAQQADSKPAAFGGFNFSAKSEETAKPAESKPFTFNATPATTSGFAFQSGTSDTSSPMKRTRDDESGETESKKKTFSISTGSSINPPFQFSGGPGASQKANSAPAGVFAFGQQNSTGTGAAQPATAPLFNFSAGPASKPAATVASPFGTVNSAPLPTAKPAGNTAPAFGTGGQFSFSADKPATTPAPASTGFAFNATTGKTGFGGTTFGSSDAPGGFATTNNAFGGSGSSNLAFGNTGSTPSGPATNAPAFGVQPAFNFKNDTSFKFGEATKQAAAPQPAQAGLFQFGAKSVADSSSSQTPQAAQTATPSTGFNFQQSAQGGFSAPTPSFNFTATAAPGTFAFNASSTPGDSSGRKIKRAVRKIKR